MSKIVTVVGAMGMQGGSVVRALLSTNNYTIRAITRNRNTDKTKALLSQGVDVVEADINNMESLRAAFAGSYAIYAVTNFFDVFAEVGVAKSLDIEVKQGINLAKAAAATASLRHYIWSTLPNSHRLSDGKVIVPHYEGKNQVDDYIRAVPALFNKTTFLWVTFYAVNINYPWYMPFTIPNSNPAKVYSVWATPAWVPIKLVGDGAVNVGLFVKSILEQPQKALPGKFVLAATDDMTAGELVAAWAHLQGKESVYLEVDKETYYNMWPIWGEEMDISHMYWELMKDQSFSGESVLTKDDLGVTGLVDTKAAFAKMQADTVGT
ncbi:NAD(P)-binding protein [Hyaloscypha variabilis F]|uniref:NAD(P)-binding protein n=1 Tax=Hyaloscypha variabilis (strain UAMH 11265 / GT02V1 / F) TaxID=1149755 RepID=A0A2J6QRY1_HYAVF|nr:NAD(P)-binding protein [Hyaloscypha variabilis F]